MTGTEKVFRITMTKDFPKTTDHGQTTGPGSLGNNWQDI